MSSSYALYSSSNDQVSFDNGGRRKRGFYLTLPIAIGAVIVFVVCIVAVGLIVGLSVKNCPEGEQQATPSTKAPEVTSTPPGPEPSSGPTPTSPPVNIRLPLDVMPESYDVILAPYLYDDSKPDTFYTKGAVDIVANVKASTRSIKLHRFHSTNISSIQVMYNSKDVFDSSTYENVPMWDVISLKEEIKAGEKVTIKVKFVSPLKPDLKGLYLSSYKDTDGKTKYLATSQLQAIDARKTFPCFDEMLFKATFDITIVRKEPYNSISNMPSIDNTTVKCTKWFDEIQTGDCIEEKYDTTPIMSTYILAFIVSELGYIERCQNGHQYRNWARPELLDIADYAMDAVTNITEYFEGYYEVEYPLNKTDQAAVPDFNAGAMENWGLIIYRESRLLFDSARDTSAIKRSIGGVISHELAHMWFGNLVTPDWWSDTWLNEGFASFTQDLGVDQLHPSWEIDSQFVALSMRSAMNVDSKGASHPIYMDVTTNTGIEGIFDTITYRKGASVLRQLYGFIGDNLFKTGIGNYLRNNSYSNTNHTSLHQILKKTAADADMDIDVEAIMERWILQMGYPVVNCSLNGDKLTLTQNHFLSDPSQKPDPKFKSPFNYTWYVPISMATSKNVSMYTNARDISKYVVWFNEKEQSFAVKDSPDWYLLNLRSTGFYRINYDKENWQKLINQLQADHTVFAPHDRSRMIQDSFTLAAAGYINYSIPMDVTKYLVKEEHHVPWLSAMSELSYVYRMLHRQSPVYGPFSAYMRSLLQPQFAKTNLTEADPTHLGKLQQNLVVTYACMYGLKDCKTETANLFTEFKKSNYSGTFLKPDVRARILCEGISSSYAEDWDEMYEAMMKETHPGMRIDMLRSLGCSNEPWILSRFLEYAVDDSKIRRQDSSTVFSSVAANPNGLQIVFDFIRGNWDLLVDRMPGSFTIGYFVQNFALFNTEQKLNDIRAFKEENKDKLGTAASRLDVAIEDVQLNIQWMDSKLNDVKNWLQQNSKP